MTLNEFPNKPRVEILMERNAKKTARRTLSLTKSICKCDTRYMNKTRTLDRNCISKKQYIRLLSTPRSAPSPPDQQPPKKKRKHFNAPCPPRIEQLARPNMAKVLNTWQNYYNVLAVERTEKLQRLLYNVTYMDPKKALYHFKRLKADKRRKKKKKPKSDSKLQLTWMQHEEMQTAKAIMDYFKKRPLSNVKYRHMCITDKLLDMMERKNLLRKPKRKTKSHYEKTLIEIADQVAVWFDRVIEDLEAVERKEAEEAEAIASSLELSVVGEEEEGGEGEEEEEEEEEEESEYSLASIGIQATSLEELISGDLLDEALLRKLIEILESGEPGLLDELIDPTALPRIRYGDVLCKLKDFDYTGEPIKSERGERLDAAMTEWATMNDSERFDKKLRELVKFLAGILAHLLFMDWGRIEGGVYGEEGEDEAITELTTIGAVSSEAEYSTFQPDRLEPADYADMLEDTIRGGEDDGSGGGGGGAGGGGEAMYGDGLAVEEEVDKRTVTDLSAAASSLGDTEMMEGADLTEGGMMEGADLTEGGMMEGADLTEGGLMDISSVEGEEMAALEGEAMLEEGYAEEGLEVVGAVQEGEELATGAPALTPSEEARLAAEAAAATAETVEEGLAPPTGGELATTGPRGVIFGHKPSVVFDHTPDGICCLSLKIYALWLYEVAENAHNWSSWLIEVIQEVRNYTRIVKGEVKNPDGTKRVLKKDEWRQFVEKIEKMIVSWRQYSQHIGSLSDRLIQTIHDKKVTCCPKCLSDNLIKDLAAANCLTEELTEAITTATYWRQWLDNMIDQTKRLTTIPVFTEDEKKAIAPKKKVCVCATKPIKKAGVGPSQFAAPKRVVQLHKTQQDYSSSDEDDESIYELEEIDPNKPSSSKRGSR